MALKDRFADHSAVLGVVGLGYVGLPLVIEMAKAVDTLIVITPGGPSAANLDKAEVMSAMGTRGIIVNVALGSVIDEPTQIAAQNSGTSSAARHAVFA